MTETDVCNMALGMLGHDRTVKTDVRTDSSTEAVRCRLYLDVARRGLLGMPGGWAFARARLGMCLERCKGEVSGRDLWEGRLPDDCLYVERVMDGAERGGVAHWGCDRGVVTSSERQVLVVYIRDVVEIGEWPQPLVDALVARLAGMLAGPMLGSAEKAGAIRREALEAEITAALWEARQGGKAVAGGGRYISARR